MPPPISPRAYSQQNVHIAEVSMECARNSMSAASARLHCLRNAGLQEIIDITVTCNGTWSKRGFTATYGVVIVIACETGQVLDFEIKFKRCSACTRNCHSCPCYYIYI